MDSFRRMKKMIEANDLKSFRGNPAILLKAICQLRAKAVPWKALQVHTFFPSRAKVSKKNRRLNRSCEDGGRAATYRKVDRSTHRFVAYMAVSRCIEKDFSDDRSRNTAINFFLVSRYALSLTESFYINIFSITF